MTYHQTYSRPHSPAMIPSSLRNKIDNNSRNIYFVGAVACAGCLIGIGSFWLCRRLKTDVGLDLTALKRELETLKDIVANRDHREDYVVDSVIGLLKNSTDLSNSFSTESENNIEVYFDAPEKVPEHPSDPFLRELFDSVDYLLLNDCDENRVKSYNLLHQAYPKYKDNWDFLWRYARSTFLYGQNFMNCDQEKRLQYIQESRNIIYQAFELNRHDAEVHKWCAIIVGLLSDFVGLKQRIHDGAQIKWHIDKALALTPSDFILHHLCGRWCYNVAALSWIERKLAKTFFHFQVPSFDEALDQFLKAEHLRPHWHENLLYIIKCYIGKKDYTRAVEWIKKANEMEPLCVDDVAAKKDIEALKF